MHTPNATLKRISDIKANNVGARACHIYNVCARVSNWEYKQITWAQTIIEWKFAAIKIIIQFLWFEQSKNDNNSTSGRIYSDKYLNISCHDIWRKLHNQGDSENHSGCDDLPRAESHQKTWRIGKNVDIHIADDLIPIQNDYSDQQSKPTGIVGRIISPTKHLTLSNEKE